jgi:preprotein translocase subunit SecG
VTTFLLVVHALIALALVTVILLQRSEGGGLGIGGGTGGGMVSVRGAANLLTRATTALAVMFIGTSILLAVLAAGTSKPRTVDTSLASEGAPVVAPVGEEAVGEEAAPALPGALPDALPAAPLSAPAEGDGGGVPLAR